MGGRKKTAGGPLMGCTGVDGRSAHLMLNTTGICSAVISAGA